MDISEISTSVSARGQFASARAGSSSELLPPQRTGSEDNHKHDQQSIREHVSRGQALGAFKQELRVRISARFAANHSAAQKIYAETEAPDTAEKIAATAVGEAKQIAAESPVQAAKSFISFRAIVRETQSYVRETLGENQNFSELDDAVAKVDGALTALEGAASRNVESSASVLAVDTSSKQRSAIRIRTQEGDVVNFSLRNSSRLSATDSASAANGKFSSVTEVQLSSRSRLALSIEGDLNESELAAIKNVFVQAEKIANEFFDGDIGAAFSLAEGFEFDTEQLARVNLGFRSREVSRVSYAEPVREATNPVAIERPVTPTSTAFAEAVPEVNALPPEPAVETTIPSATKVAEEQEQGQSTALASSALSSFFDALSTFLRSVGDGFSADSGSGSFQLHYSESFKLELLRAVVHTIAPEKSERAAASADAVIDAVTEGSEDRLEV